MAYPLSSDVSAGQPTAAAHYNTLRADALRLGQPQADCVPIGQFLTRFARGIRLVMLAANRLRLPYVTSDPPTLLINGCMCQATANVDLPPAQFSGAAATWYVFACRAAGSSQFTLAVNTSPVEGADQRIIGEAQWDGANLLSVKDYFAGPIGDPDYDSGWFSVTTNQTFTKTHSLGQVPRLTLLLHATNSSGTGELVPVLLAQQTSAQPLSVLGMDPSNLYIQTPTADIVHSTRRAVNTGYYRLLAWR
jgi:hypothetical protein